MKYKKYAGRSIIGWLNLMLLQFFFIRLQMNVSDDLSTIKGLQIIGFIVPITGWRTTCDYIYFPFKWQTKLFKI